VAARSSEWAQHFSNASCYNICTEKTCPSHLNNVLTLPCENETSHFTLHNPLLVYSHCIKCGVKHKVYQIQRKQLIVSRYVQNVRHRHEHEHASLLATSQLCHQSATAPSRATHAAVTDVMNSGLMHTLLNERPNNYK